MLWKTDEKALLEKRGEDRGKLMLTGRSVTKTSRRGRGVSVHMDRHMSCFGTLTPVNQSSWSFLRWELASPWGLSVTRKMDTLTSANTKT